MGLFGNMTEKYGDYIYVISRIGIGILFLMLGVQKISGLWGMPGGPAVFLTLVWFAGIFEVMIGLSLVTGVLVRLASFFGVIMMLVAYYLGHVTTGGWNPVQNYGISALAFGLAFLITLVHGAKKASLEKSILGREIF